MRRRLTVILVLAMVTAVPATALADVDPDHFDGVWVSTDHVDGSNQLMIIRQVGATERFRVTLFDDGGTFCDATDPTTPLIARGLGTMSGNDLNVSFDIRCFNGVTGTGIPATYTYDHATGVLAPGTDNWTLIYDF